nr:hypothetical protein FNV92_11670 [Bradyrhizobium cosmicum]
MAGLVPAIHAFIRTIKTVDARDKPGHDEGRAELTPPSAAARRSGRDRSDWDCGSCRGWR